MFGIRPGRGDGPVVWRKLLFFMNIEEIGEPVRVLAVFAGGSAQPVRFRWGRREHEIEAINGRWIDRKGDGYGLHYSVQAGGQTYYLHFDSVEVQWWLDRVIVE
jgi:hypothetical protein